jgi:hypothetical protein
MEGRPEARLAKVGVRSNTVGRKSFADVFELRGREWISYVATLDGTASGYMTCAGGGSAPLL